MSNEFDWGLLDNAIIRGGLRLYNYDDAISLVQLCSRNHIKVLGIDAFYLSDDYTQPVMEHSVDLSSKEIIEGNENAYQFLCARKNLGLFFEIVY